MPTFCWTETSFTIFLTGAILEMIPIQKYNVILFVSIFLFVATCKSPEKKEALLPVFGEKRAELPILLQFEEDQEYDVKTLLVTFFTGTEGKDRRTDREYAKFPILVGTGARAKEIELEGTVTRRESVIRSERKEVNIYVEGNKISHNCGLGVTEKSSSSESIKKQFRSVKIFFRNTGEKDYGRTGVSLAVGMFTYLLYPLFYSGFVVEKMDCGLILEG